MLRSMTAIAKQALGTRTIIREVPQSEREFRVLTLPDHLKNPPTIDAADIVSAIQEAARENTAMTERETSITETFRASLNVHREQIETEIGRIKHAQSEADVLHADHLQQLRDEITNAEAIHTELTNANDARINDALLTLEGINKALNATAPLPVDVMTNNGCFYDALKRTPMGLEFHDAWKHRYDEFPPDPTLTYDPASEPVEAGKVEKIGRGKMKVVPAAAAEGGEA